MESHVEERLRELVAACRKAGAKVTHQRREVLRAVVASEIHPDAQTILARVRERMPTISFDTVYRTLAFLEEHDLIRRVHVSGERARFDGNRKSHHHFICTNCGKIVDFENEDFDSIPLPPDVLSLGKSLSTQLQVFGICTECSHSKGDHRGAT
jgi:Fur family transcriptional regulator, peroxide stress response regulator